jgi:hypothetical protein
MDAVQIQKKYLVSVFRSEEEMPLLSACNVVRINSRAMLSAETNLRRN